MLNKSKIMISLLLINLLFTSFLHANSVNKKNILMLHSYHSGMTWIENINTAVNNTLISQSNNFVLYTEYMDTKRHSSQEYYESLKEIYLKKYKNIKFDIILSSDNNAFDFLVKNRDEIFGEVPVSFCGVNGFEKDMLKNVELFTGVAEQFSDKETIDTILRLHPNVKNIYIINDYLATGQAWTKDMEKSLKEYENKINIEYAQNLTLENLKNKINSFDTNTVILLGVYFADKDKNYITYEKIGSYLMQESKAPVYCLLNFNISNNVIGGKVIGGYSQGEAMSKVALKILNGENPENIKIAFSEANEYIFNYNGIIKYDIDKTLLPKNSKIINKPFSLYEEYKAILTNLIIIFSLVLILFIALLFYLRIKNRSKHSQRDNLIVSIIRFTPFVIIPIVTASIVWLFIFSANKNYEQLKEVEKENYIENMKQQSQREVDRFIQIIKSRIALAKNPDELEQIKQHAIYVVQNIKYGKSGYIFIGSMQGYMVSHPNKKLIGINFFDGKHEKVKNVFHLFEKKLEAKGSGFVEYNWINPNSKQEEQKITYVNYLSEFDWYVASGVYLDEIDRHIEQKVKNNAILDERNINILIITSAILLVFSFIISYILSIIIKNSFAKYKNSIMNEIEKTKTIEKAKEEVDIQKEEFERLFEFSPVAMAFIQNDGQISRRNTRFIKTFGYTKEDAPDTKQWYKVAYPDEEYRNNAVAKWQFELIRASRNTGMVTPIEVNITAKNGKVHNIIISSIVLKNGILSSFIDLTKQKQQEKLIFEQSKLVAMGEMIGNISHQWRQPLSVISTGATGLKVAKEYGTLTDEIFMQTCDTINDNAQYLSNTIDDFRDFIKGDRKIVKFHLLDNINSFLHLVEGTIKNNDIKVIIDVDKNISINSYPNELIQCFINIFNNAKDALKDVHEERYIFISAQMSDNQVEIVFKDNAKGIPEDILPRIFEPYFTTKHKSKGTGLGLHMTYNLIVEGMHGSIEAENKSYKYQDSNYTGAVFTITLAVI